MAIPLFLVGVVVVVLAVAWASDRRDLPGGVGRFRRPSAMGSDAKLARRGARARRAMIRRGMDATEAPTKREKR